MENKQTDSFLGQKISRAFTIRSSLESQRPFVDEELLAANHTDFVRGIAVEIAGNRLVRAPAEGEPRGAVRSNNRYQFFFSIRLTTRSYALSIVFWTCGLNSGLNVAPK